MSTRTLLPFVFPEQPAKDLPGHSLPPRRTSNPNMLWAKQDLPNLNNSTNTHEPNPASLNPKDPRSWPGSPLPTQSGSNTPNTARRDTSGTTTPTPLEARRKEMDRLEQYALAMSQFNSSRRPSIASTNGTSSGKGTPHRSPRGANRTMSRGSLAPEDMAAFTRICLNYPYEDQKRKEIERAATRASSHPAKIPLLVVETSSPKDADTRSAAALARRCEANVIAMLAIWCDHASDKDGSSPPTSERIPIRSLVFTLTATIESVTHFMTENPSIKAKMHRPDVDEMKDATMSVIAILNTIRQNNGGDAAWLKGGIDKRTLKVIGWAAAVELFAKCAMKALERDISDVK
ncbi:hypothetical protein BJ742DRAFT_827023 [Cladochytrium replicatum]|nr:hypothetical protein BJ742DRAFT_827023 [Cladochytrium replicatum]